MLLHVNMSCPIVELTSSLQSGGCRTDGFPAGKGKFCCLPAAGWPLSLGEITRISLPLLWGLLAGLDNWRPQRPHYLLTLGYIWDTGR